MRAQLISPLVGPVVKVATLPPRLAGRVGGVVAGQLLGTARLVASEVRDLLGRDGGPGVTPTTPAPTTPAPTTPAPTVPAHTAPARPAAVRPRLVPEAPAAVPDTVPDERPMEGVVDSIVEAIEEATPAGPPVSHDALPLEDYDHLTIGQLRSRIRSLSLDELGQLQAYEVAHANRLPVLAVLTNRIRSLESKAQAGAGQ